MNKILVALDDTKGSKAAAEVLTNIFACACPKTIILLYVEKLEGWSMMDEMLGEPEMATLKEALEDSEYKEVLDRKAEKILDFYKKALEKKGITGIKTIIKSGHPAEEILKTAKAEKAEMIIIGSRGKRAHTVLLGSVSREVTNSADIPVLVAR